MEALIKRRNTELFRTKRFFDLLYGMTEKEIKTRYKKAVFGFFWIILNPILQMLIIGLIFQYVTRVPIENYFYYLFSGLLPWNLFSYTITKNTPAIIYERSLIQKAKFPTETIILSIVLSNTFHTIISILLFLPLAFYKGLIGLNFLLIFPAIIWMVAFISGVSLLFSALNVKYRDVNFFVQAVVPLWFYITPVLYSINFLPEKIRWVLYLNPVTGIIELFHASLLNQPINWTGAATSSLISLFIIIIGVKIFHDDSKYFSDWI